MTYQTFLNSKEFKLENQGIEVANCSAAAKLFADLPSILFDYQKLIVKIALEKGKFAIFAGCGMGKSLCQLVWAQIIAEYTGGNVLILAPLAVAKQTAFDESLKFKIPVTYCESDKDVKRGINITNYEKLGKFNGCEFVGVVLDESSILKSFSSATRNQLIDRFYHVPYKLACTATPAPNDFMELGNHSQFLGVMSRVEMLSQFFVHDGGNTSQWVLKKHGQKKFWQWLAQWSIMLAKPSDIGFSDRGFELPPISYHQIKIESNLKLDGELFAVQARSLTQQRQAKRQTLTQRVQAVADLVNGSEDQWLVWCELNDESSALKSAIADSTEVKGSDSDRSKEQALFDFAHGKTRVLISKPSICGFGMNFQNCHNVVFVGLSHSFEQTYQAIRRCWRFGQTQPVNIYFVIADVEGDILNNLKRKEQQFERMQSELVAHFRDVFGQVERRDYNPTQLVQLPQWLIEVPQFEEVQEEIC